MEQSGAARSRGWTSWPTAAVVALLILIASSMPGEAAEAAPAYDTLLSLSSNRSAAVSLGGTSVQGLIYVFVQPETGIQQVRFYIDDPSMSQSPRQLERLKPYDFAGTASNGSTALPFDTDTVTDGSHTITAAVVLSAGGTQVLHSTFTVANNPAGPASVRVNFQSETGPVPAGYVRDYGQPYGPRTGANQGVNLVYGWVVPGTSTPLSLVGKGRDRNAHPDQRLDTLMHMQQATQGAWEIALANGTYAVALSVGDPSYLDSTHRITIEGEVAIPGFVPTSAARFASTTRTVTVSDGRLTIGAQGGTNTKIDYLIATGPDTTPPAAPSNVAATAAPGQVTLSWNANSESDLAGYNVYRGTSLPVSTSTPVNGGTLLTGTQYVDSPLTNGTMYFYVVEAVDTAANKAAAAPVEATPLASPSVAGVSPGDEATLIARDTSVSAQVSLPNVGYGIDPATLTAGTVKLLRASDDAQVSANLSVGVSGDVVVLQPSAQLEPWTRYGFEVTTGLKDESGTSFLPHASHFTTIGPVRFEKVALPAAAGRSFSGVTLGPDGKLYAGTIQGEILRFPLNPDGTTGPAEVLSSLQTANGGRRMLIGLAFDPSATATNLVLWVSHSTFGFSNMPDWGGKITRLSGANLEIVQDYVVNLPRSIRDHVTNGLAFGPDGALYVNQGSITDRGAPDPGWGNRSERALSAAVLRIELAAIAAPPLDTKTADGGTYDPFAPGAPVRVYGSGLRNAYDLLWHSNGQLYIPTNGANPGGNTPATPSPLPPSCTTRIDDAANGDYLGPQVPGITNATGTTNDYLFRIVDGGYYGHPNPSRCEWALNGGNPTSALDPGEVGQYPVGTSPDRNWRGYAFDLGVRPSANGVIEYRSDAFGGTLQGKLLVVRYAVGDDIVVLTPGPPNLDIVGMQTGIEGLTAFADPVDLTENPATGHVYVSEYGTQKITMLRPLDS